MKFGLVPVNIGVAKVEQMIAVAQKAEALGFESLWTFEHVIVPVDYESRYPYNAEGKMGATPETPFVDPLVALSVLATATKTLRLGTGINILPQANPLLLAKQAASLDFVSGGRFELGLGIGWLREEFEALGVPFEGRGRRFDDYLNAMKKVWSGEVVEHESEFLNWKNFKSYPLPVQKPHLPLVIGGSKPRALRRVAEHGDGWFAPAAAPDQLGGLKPLFEKACSEAGRDASSIEVSTMWNPSDGLDAVRKFEDLGASRLITPLMALGQDPIGGLERLAEEVIAKS